MTAQAITFAPESLEGTLATMGAMGAVQKQDVAVTLGALAGSLLVVKGFDALAERGLIEQNLSRKLIHTTCGPLFIISWLFFTSSDLARYVRFSTLSRPLPFSLALSMRDVSDQKERDKSGEMTVKSKD